MHPQSQLRFHFHQHLCFKFHHKTCSELQLGIQGLATLVIFMCPFYISESSFGHFIAGKIKIKVSLLQMLPPF